MLTTHLSYGERAHHCRSPLAKRLLQLMEEKTTNLAVSADVTRAEQLLELADRLGPEICVLKTHIDIINDFTPALTEALRQLAHQHQFLLFEDRKFADIGHTVKLQYEEGIYHIADWADIVNAHTLPGPGIIQGLAKAGIEKNRGLLLLAELSSAGNLIDPHYIEKTLSMAEQFAEFVIGFVAQHALSPQPHWLYFTPGIQLGSAGDSLGQQYITPEQAVLQGSDIIIVGRGIIGAQTPLVAAQSYKKAGWDAYRRR